MEQEDHITPFVTFLIDLGRPAYYLFQVTIGVAVLMYIRERLTDRPG